MAKKASAKRGAPESGDIISLKVTLNEIRPPIWRRVLVPANMTLADLHQAIQAAMGWMDGHMHTFNIGGRQFGDPTMIEDAENEARMKLRQLQRTGVKRFGYTYDFGDDWVHTVLIEARPPATMPDHVPACVAGERCCPPEDCGGPWGYEELLAILADPDHPEHEERLEWLGGEFDPEEFEVAAADAAVGSTFGRA
ncbi:MAG TPA: plasmid pRiA4b ORF-3 family protein [Acetobacteraceae bacterium]|jgi:hypothetical protein